MTERAAFFEQLQADYDATAAQLEEQQKPLGALEASAFCNEKAEYLQREADAATERAASALHEVEETRADLRSLNRPRNAVSPDRASPERAAARAPLEARAAHFQAEADVLTDRVSFLMQEAGEMGARAKLLGAAEAAAGPEARAARMTCLRDLADGLFDRRRRRWPS